MLKAFTHLQVRLATRDRGATAVEYALMVSLIAIVIIFAVSRFSTTISTTFNNISTKLGG